MAASPPASYASASATPQDTIPHEHHLQAITQAWQHLHSSHPAIVSTAAIILAFALLLPLLYWLALPKPLPGIPYNKASARRLLGDVPALTHHMTQDQGTFASYLANTLVSLNAPLVQVFIRPLSRPLLVLGDFRESQDVLGHRGKDFDRSSSLGDLVRGIGPDHHVLLKTNDAWKAQRRLIQDLMTPSFLNRIAGPAMHQSMLVLLDLWREKARIAAGRPWDARHDINWETLDAVHAFSYGADFGHSASKPTLDVVRALDAQAVKKLRSGGGPDEPVVFPEGKVDELAEASMTLMHTCTEVQGSPVPNLKWKYIMRKPRVRRATAVKERIMREEVESAVASVERDKGQKVKSAADQMVVREKKVAEREGRKPDYFSRAMMDELFGFVVAGHDTTSTTMLWSVKILAENQSAQTELRDLLRASYTAAWSEGRDPSIEDITGTPIPYLDAFLEELMRCANTVPIVDREALVDTELLGYHIPKGTVISCLASGPSLTAPPFEIAESKRHQTQGSGKEGAKRVSWDPSDATLFKPERWLVDGKFDPLAGPQLAFGLGTRQCYGKRLAYLKLRIGIVLLVWDFEVLRCPEALSSFWPTQLMSSEPKDCYLRLREIVRDGR
ncbi:cytochrome P450 monooxygenase [Bombardia bombarda]|uniref:Cytochrome P450 monooxygenase n=1 Tax=Bombardia bombarda TaxID=252184 RepID=A0AA39X1G8_9PEZI|nr:cytochrome P450 monooxygenase [Bombardia bombarda]